MQQPRATHALCAVVLCCLLVAGLWPFGHPQNDVTWIANKNGVRLGKHGTILSAGPLPARNVDSCSIGIWLRPNLSQASSTVLAFYGWNGLIGLSLHQSLTDLRVDAETGRKPSKIYIGDVFRAGRLVYLTVVSGSRGIAVYVDGALVHEVSQPRSFREACSGSFILGDSPVEHDTWEGEIRGLASYPRELTARQVQSSYRSWRNNGRPGEGDGDMPDALYLFNEAGGRWVHDHGASGVSLHIPERYVIAQQTLLKDPWRAFEPTWDYVLDILINIGGFVPFGFTFRACLALHGRMSRIGTVTVLAGLVVSLGIESLQALLPTRNSDLTDVLTNTAGTYLGVLLHRFPLPRPPLHPNRSA